MANEYLLGLGGKRPTAARARTASNGGELGYRFDAGLNRLNLRRRNYEAQTARFLSEDPPEGERDANRFSYAGNNPANRADPTGPFFEKKACRLGNLPKRPALLPYPEEYATAEEGIRGGIIHGIE